MVDASTLALNLTFIGTLGIAFLIFVGQLVSFAVLLCLATAVQLLAAAFQALRPSVRRNSAKVLRP
ncbi:endonuclease/exonuclease/phosphatase (EEP) superfamily protein YafD [Arthrobacter oryzae]|jgi:endonuclease/exonuclease/phosphatase (EEP) superfamily protein YafD|nr:endonuclease/exonuclease/phosphatase (EEP) superfamily protein YafD [Arthrobacter oryzae]